MHGRAASRRHCVENVVPDLRNADLRFGRVVKLEGSGRHEGADLTAVEHAVLVEVDLFK